VDTDLYGGYVIARVSTGSTTGAGATTGEGLAPLTPEALPEPDAFTSLRNLFYAAEWVVFGGFALFLWWRWSRDELDRVAALERADGGEAEDASPEGDADETVPAAEIASSS
jgi:surfeit locus 1 family protein